MAIPVVQTMDFNLLELLNATAQNLAAAPAHKAGRFYYDTVSGKLGVSDGAAWTYLSTAAGLDSEAVQDIVGAMIGGTVVTATYNDTAGTVTLGIGAGQVTDAMLAGSINADKTIDGTTNKVFLAAEKTKLTSIATGATANDTDINLKARANHTGTQLAATISDFAAAADARINLIIDAAPATLDTLNELAAALGDDPNFATTMTNALAAKASIASLAAVATAGTYASLTGKPLYTVTIGDAAATSFTITHNLNSRNVIVDVSLLATPYTQVQPEIAKTTVNTVTVIFATAPSLNQYAVTVQA